MNRRGFLTGLASLVVPVPASVTPIAQHVLGTLARAQARGIIVGRGSFVSLMPDGSYRIAGGIRDIVITGKVSV